jgi:GT2 family glycosyltransferase
MVDGVSGEVRHYPATNRPTAPVCSICIANYNGIGLLDDCLGSVFAQHGGQDIEVIIHDDASTDDSVTLLRSKYPQVELLASHENVGFCVANNRMVEHARGEFVLLLNNDAALHSDAVQALLHTASEQVPCGILTLPQYDWETGELVDRGCLLDPFYNPVPNLDATRADVAYAIGACLFVPRALWNELGGFPEWIESIGEDMYLGCQVRLRELSVRCASSSGYRHRQGASFGGNRATTTEGLQTTFRRRFLSERNKTAVMLICMPTVLVWPLAALHLLLLCIEGAVLAMVKWDRRYWQQIYAPAACYVFREFGTLRTRRRKAQERRKVSLGVWLSVFTLMPRKLNLLWRYGVPKVQ